MIVLSRRQAREFAAALRLDAGQPAKSAHELALPASALAAIGGEGDGLVRLEAAGKDRGRASLVEEASSRSLTFSTRPPDTLPPFPALPSMFEPVDRGFLGALRE